MLYKMHVRKKGKSRIAFLKRSFASLDGCGMRIIALVRILHRLLLFASYDVITERAEAL